jgi:3-methyladenine DNA glycosylase AlkD
MKNDLDPRYKAILKIVEDYCMDHEDPAIVNKYAHFFREGYDAFGLLEEQVKELSEKVLENNQLTVDEIAELSWHLFSTGKFEYGSVAILLLKKFRPEFNRTVFDWVHKCFDSGVENWAHSDTLCGQILPVMFEQNVVNLEDFIPWRTSKSKWTRRAVPVTLINLLKTIEPQDLLDFIDPMMRDEDRVVHQGLGWFLREMWKLNHQLVEDFLFTHKQHCARLIVQYATEKMKQETKDRFRKDKLHKNKQNKRKPEKKPEPQAKKVTKSISPLRRGSEILTPKPKTPHPNKVKS